MLSGVDSAWLEAMFNDCVQEGTKRHCITAYTSNLRTKKQALPTPHYWDATIAAEFRHVRGTLALEAQALRVCIGPTGYISFMPAHDQKA